MIMITTNKETLTILDEFMNEQYSIQLTKPLFEKLGGRMTDKDRKEIQNK